MKLGAVTCLVLAAASVVAMVTGGRNSGRRKQKEVFLEENSKFKFGGRIDHKLKRLDSTKTLLIKSEQLLRIEEHDFAMRPGFGGAAIPVGIDVQVESIDSISEVNMDFTMTLYLRHYWKDERLAFPSQNNQSRTFDSRLVKKIWVPDVFFVHSKRSFIHDTTMENIMLRVYPDGNILFSVSGYNRYNANTVTNRWYNRLFITFILRRHIFFFMLQTYFPTMLMVVLSWVSFWIDRRAVPARVSLGITTVLTMSTIITGVSSSMPQVSYVKAVDIYLWTSFLFVFLSVIEYAAVNYCTTLEETRKMKRGKIPSTFNATQAMAFDGCFHDNEMELTPFPRMTPTLTPDPLATPSQVSDTRPIEGTRLRRQRSVRENVDLLVSNSYLIDSYSRLAFPLSYLLFNTIYWSLYS
ncbi:hypothetical protein fugu_016073 [Takifugu bimaculatus]|uniref:Uncharacterized protein n=1 Tax=Takifugu bimaculatus TaxID=433685 RepID=A0A4Z2BWN1_9TELE|nr:hypothetical protein fugu_016073 [Takifugu bimaculatus]